jgi:hypothetical protein
LKNKANIRGDKMNVSVSAAKKYDGKPMRRWWRNKANLPQGGSLNDAKQSQFQTLQGLHVNDTEDCHGPLGLAMTSLSLLLCALVSMTECKKQSQFSCGHSRLLVV